MSADPDEDTAGSLASWVLDTLQVTEDEARAMKLPTALDLFISRIEAASKRGAADPLATITAKAAGGNSRASTRRMLAQLRHPPAQRRAVDRLLTGSPSGWPGLLRLYVTGQELTDEQRQYACRQVQILRGSDPDRVAQPGQRGMSRQGRHPVEGRDPDHRGRGGPRP